MTIIDAESAKTVVHAFITSRIDGCNTVLAGSPRTITDRLQCLLNAAARVVSNTGKFFVAGPMAWNALPDDLQDPSLSADNFRKTLNTHLFRNALGHLAH